MGTTIALATSHLVPSSHVSQQINHHPLPLMSYYLCLQRASGWRLNFSLAPFPSACLLPVECGFFGFAPSVKDGLTASCKYAVPTIHHVDIFHRTFVFLSYSAFFSIRCSECGRPVSFHRISAWASTRPIGNSVCPTSFALFLFVERFIYHTSSP